MNDAYHALSHVYDSLMYDVDYDKWADYIISLLDECDIDVHKVTEAACGTGNITERLAKRGFQVTALDISLDMLQIASKKALDNGVTNITFVHQDMLYLSVPKTDAVISCCDGVNYLLSKAEVIRFFKNSYNCLRPDGIFLFDISSEYKLKKVLANEIFFEDTGELTYIWQNSFDRKTDCVTMDITLFLKDGKTYVREDEVHIQRAHKQDEINKWLIEAGFSNVKAYQFLTKDAAGKKDERIQFVAVRK